MALRKLVLLKLVLLFTKAITKDKSKKYWYLQLWYLSAIQICNSKCNLTTYIHFLLYNFVINLFQKELSILIGHVNIQQMNRLAA